MRRRTARPLALVAMLGALALLAAAPARPATTLPRHDPEALELLQRAARAPATTAYVGTQVVSTASAAPAVVDVDHLPGRATVVRAHGAAAGGTFPGEGPGGDVGLLARNYSLRVVGAARVAGRAATTVEARSRAGAPAARFWIDDASGLLLRSEAYDRRGRVRRASGFRDVRVGAAAWLGHLPPRAGADVGRQVGAAELDALRAQGCVCPAELPGSLTLVRARRLGPAAGDALHLVYSDGLETASLFAQQGALDSARLPGYRTLRIGAQQVQVSGGYPRRLVWSAGGQVYTLVSDTPEARAESVLAALAVPRGRDNGGVRERLGRGFGRLASWVNPLR